MYASEFILSFIQLILWLYFICFLFFIILSLVFFIVFKLTPPVGSKLNYLTFGLFTVSVYCNACFLLLPLFILRPWHYKNSILAAWIVRKVSYVSGFSIELRGASTLAVDRGAVVCCNHRAGFDGFSKYLLFNPNRY